MLSAYYYLAILAPFVMLAAAIAFHVRQRSWWTLSLLVSNISMAVWYPLDQWAVALRLESNPTALETATLRILEALGLFPPLLFVSVFTSSLLAVALTTPRRARN